MVLQHCSLDNRQLLRNGKQREFEFECTGGETLSGKIPLQVSSCIIMTALVTLVGLEVHENALSR